MYKKIDITFLTSCIALLAIFPFECLGEDCWIASEIKGKSATAFDNYVFTDNSFKDGMLICFTDDGGLVTGNDIPLVRFGKSTLVGVSITEKGLEVVNTYQIDRANRILLITQSRLGTHTITTILPDNVSAFAGKVVPAGQ
ncbi:hypothetical protein [Desulfovibrio psychrotolerans]|uniref:Uncharacterized protein n=1 Tax=Desulfovibrio psychrotolerans TaxID=415242 RepID=A0A7J0BQD8_9BACT|nr:hypothetical protein [Desulfovibrio psychrotolerans]GFM35927.1 hypothetical protein DSM19430T_06110 [Desulfovibrio psychrotolerans]